MNGRSLSPERRHRMSFVRSIFAICLASCQIAYSQDRNAESATLPELRKVGPVTQLYVDGKPFIALGGELGNSIASDLTALDAALEKRQRMNLNAVLLPVYWDRIEPEEGKFDFTLVQGAIVRARARDMRLVLLWFGTWKNSMSCYAPSWVKRNTARFERVKLSSGERFKKSSAPKVARPTMRTPVRSPRSCDGLRITTPRSARSLWCRWRMKSE
jgi:hypothetical protein